MIRWAVFASGNGTNLQNVLDLEKAGQIPHQEIVLIHADRECKAMERALKSNKMVWKESPKTLGFVDKLLMELSAQRIDRIFLLGYMRILSPEFLKKWQRPVLNLHPSMLPKYRGLEAIERAYQAGDELVGVSLHEVVEELDAGPILLQKSLQRDPIESLESLTERIHRLEHQMVREYLLSLERSL